MSYIDAGYAIALSVLALTAPCSGAGANASSGAASAPRGTRRRDRAHGVAPRIEPSPPGLDAGVRRPSRAAAPVSAERGAPGRRGTDACRRLWVVGAVLVGAFVFLLVEGLGSSLNYFETVDQAVPAEGHARDADLPARGSRRARDRAPQPRRGRFVAAGTLDRVAVVNHGNPPQLFQPDIPVVVVGHFSGATFVSDQLIVDHTAQYIQQHPNRVRAPNGTTR